MNELHHINSPASLERRMLCPASMAMESGMPDEQKSEICAEGTLLHERIVTGVTHDLTLDQAEMVERCRMMVSQLAVGSKFFCLEKKMRLIGSSGSVITYGTADVVIVHHDSSADLVDWKFGYNEVTEAANNIQIAAYAAMVMQTFGVSRVRAKIEQPRVKGTLEEYEFRDDNLLNIILNVEAIIRRCEENALTFCPSKKACTNCRRNTSCEAHRLWSLGESVEVAKRDTSLMSVRDYADLIVDYADKLDAANKLLGKAKQEVVKEYKSSGYLDQRLEAKETKGNRKITDIEKVWGILKDTMTQEDFIRCAELSIAKTEDAYVRSNAKRKETGEVERGEVKRLKDDLSQKIGHLVSRGESSISIKVKGEK